jgi:hypothetical protein
LSPKEVGKSFEDIRRLKKPNEVSVEMILNPELTRTIDELERRHATAERRDKKENRTPVAPGLQKQIDELREQAEDEKVTFVFRDIGRRKFDALVEAFPPTPAQKKDKFQWNPDGFVPALWSSAAIDPKMSDIDAQEIYDEWGRGDVEALFNAALQACLEQASVPFTRRDTEAIMDSVSNLITQQNEE